LFLFVLKYFNGEDNLVEISLLLNYVVIYKTEYLMSNSSNKKMEKNYFIPEVNIKGIKFY